MTDKIGFVDTDNQDQQEPIMGYIENKVDDKWEFWQTLIVNFLVAFGVLVLVKETLLFLAGLKKGE